MCDKVMPCMCVKHNMKHLKAKCEIHTLSTEGILTHELFRTNKSSSPYCGNSKGSCGFYADFLGQSYQNIKNEDNDDDSGRI